jgi:splicing factor 3A subunit 1
MATLIRPPPDLRAIVDKTAAFIGKMGDEFEARIQSQSGGDVSKFRFLSPSDPYHAYYKHKVMEARSGTTTTSNANTSSTKAATTTTTTTSSSSKAITTGEAVSAVSAVSTDVSKASTDIDQNRKSVEETNVSSNVSSVAVEMEKSNIASSTQITSSTSMSVSVSTVLPNPLARALKSFDELSLSATSAPKPFYSVLTPIGITAAAADRIKLTAEFTATSGRRFLASLTSREFNNPEFDFLRPSHAHFSYYTALVDAFAKVLTPPTSVVSKIEALSDDTRSSYSFLEAVVHEAEWMRLEEEKKRKDEDANASSAVHIDWHSFVVVETVELKDFVFEKDGWDGKGSSLEAMPLGGEEDGSGDGDMDVEEEEEEMDVDNTGGGNEEFLNIRMDYTGEKTTLQESPGRHNNSSGASGVGGGGGGGGGGEVFLDPISGLSIPIDRANEHLKAQMLDPQTKVNRLRFEAKQAKTLFTTGEDVASNLKRLVSTRNNEDEKKVSLKTQTSQSVEIGVEMPPSATGPALKRPRTANN